MDEAAIRAIERPHPNLQKMYLLKALAALIAFPVVVLPLMFKYYTLRYKLDDEGVSASWGVLFRREIYLTYKRIQDIHVKRNVFERWLGIGTVDIQTASGSSSAELSLEGMSDYEGVRDFLYSRMRGHATANASSPTKASEAESGELVALLREIKGEIEATRVALEARGVQEG